MADERDEAPVGPGESADEDESNRADEQQGDPEALSVEGDPRGGTQSGAYRHADARELVEEDGVAMAGPGGAPQEGLSADERRELDRE